MRISRCVQGRRSTYGASTISYRGPISLPRSRAQGRDTGRVVHAVPDVREDLLNEYLEGPTTEARDVVAHAIAEFRRRDGSVHSKRGAILQLAGVLEERRQLLDKLLAKKDEAALFRIANEFHIRHKGDSQRRDYDEAFLDWIFWWYLATIELSDRLIARNQLGVGRALNGDDQPPTP